MYLRFYHRITGAPVRTDLFETYIRQQGEVVEIDSRVIEGKWNNARTTLLFESTLHPGKVIVAKEGEAIYASMNPKGYESLRLIMGLDKESRDWYFDLKGDYEECESWIKEIAKVIDLHLVHVNTMMENGCESIRKYGTFKVGNPFLLKEE